MLVMFHLFFLNNINIEHFCAFVCSRRWIPSFFLGCDVFKCICPVSLFMTKACISRSAGSLLRTSFELCPLERPSAGPLCDSDPLLSLHPASSALMHILVGCATIHVADHKLCSLCHCFPEICSFVSSGPQRFDIFRMSNRRFWCRRDTPRGLVLLSFPSSSWVCLALCSTLLLRLRLSPFSSMLPRSAWLSEAQSGHRQGGIRFYTWVTGKHVSGNWRDFFFF